MSGVYTEVDGIMLNPAGRACESCGECCLVGFAAIGGNIDGEVTTGGILVPEGQFHRSGGQTERNGLQEVGIAVVIEAGVETHAVRTVVAGAAGGSVASSIVRSGIAPLVLWGYGCAFVIVPAVGNGVGHGEFVEVLRPWEGGDGATFGGDVGFVAPSALVIAATVGTYLDCV